MMDPISKGYVNWIDGMKLSKEHFVQQQHAVEARLRDQRALSTHLHGHGMLAGRVNGMPSLDYRLSFDPPAKFTFALLQCRAVTAVGDRVEIIADANGQQPLSRTFDLSTSPAEEGAEYDIILRVEPFVLDPYGMHDPSESPPRPPYAGPRCSLDLAPLKDMRLGSFGQAYVALARVRVQNGMLVKDNDHIPACTSMASLPTLEEFHTAYSKFLKEAELNLLTILAKLNQRETQSELSDGAGVLCRSALHFLERELSMFQVVGARMSPLSLVMHAISFARAMHYALEMRTNKGKDALLAYMKEATGLSPLEHRQVLNALTDLVFDANDLSGALKRMLQFCQVHRKLFDHWARLKHIGTTGGSNIIIHEEQRPEAPPTARNWNF